MASLDGTNAEEAYKMTFGEGNSFSDFKQRVRSAQIAKEQLNVYKDIVGNEINTVKGTILDSALKGINQFFGIGGTASQITSLLGTMDVEEEKRISARLENKKSKKYEEGVSCPNCHDNLTDHQKSRFRMRQKQINLAKEAGKRHIFQKEY